MSPACPRSSRVSNRLRATSLALVTCAALPLLTLAIAPALAAEPARPAAPSLAAPDSVLTLPWLERTVLERNPSLAAMRSALAAAEARAPRAGALAPPRRDVKAAPARVGAASVEAAWRVGVTQPLPLFGTRGAARAAGRADADAAGADLESLRLDLLRETRMVYVDDYHVARQALANGAQLALIRQLHDAAVSRYAAGLAPEADALQAEVELAMLDHERVMLGREARLVESRLDALLHLAQGTRLPAPPDELPPIVNMSATSGDSLPWPELRAADARVAAARGELTLARRSRWPSTDLSVAYDRYWNEPELRTSVGLMIGLPVDLGQLGDAERQATHHLEAATFERDAVRDRIDQRIAAAEASLVESRHETEIIASEVLPASRRALGSARAAYASGQTPFSTVLSAARDVARAEFEVHRAQAAMHQAEAEWSRARAIDAQPNAGSAR